MASEIVANWCPPALRAAANRVIGSVTRYVGPFEDWTQASVNAAGYDEGSILHRVEESTGRVLRGEAVYEQDGVACEGLPPPAHALVALMLVAARGNGRLSVVDFGGSLASHYLRWRPLLQAIPDLRWCVVEQVQFVEVGKKLFASIPSITFCESIAKARESVPNAVLASSVLQYIENSLDALDALVELNAEVIVLDRTPFAVGTHDQVLVQHVPASLGSASYPLRTFARSSVEARLSDRYEKVMEFPSGDAPIRIRGASADYLGQVWMRRS